MAGVDCTWLLSCPFFEDPVGYSPEMGTLFVERFCRREYQACARYVARAAMGSSSVPDDMLPTDFVMLDALLTAWRSSPQTGESTE